jgi:hypothetical protein
MSWAILALSARDGLDFNHNCQPSVYLVAAAHCPFEPPGHRVKKMHREDRKTRTTVERHGALIFLPSLARHMVVAWRFWFVILISI